MSKPSVQPVPPDQAQREQALDPSRSILVQAPAGSGKTDLLTRRFLRLLAEVDEPGQVVAITFTNAAAAEMRHRILGELEKAAANPAPQADEFSMDSLAHRALEHSQALGWKLLDLPAQLRISTIDSFCRELALQQPLLSGLGGGLEIAEQPDRTLSPRGPRDAAGRSTRPARTWARPLRSCCCGATTAGRRWKPCWSKCSRAATAGCTALCWSASRIGIRCASGWSGPLHMPCARRSSG